jgi:UDP-glucose 4-epimerase
VLVTGANGFLGRHVVAALLARGHTVRAMVRPAVALEGLGWPAAVEVVRADLRGSPLEPLFEGVDVLVHLAAAVSGGEDAQFAASVGGTERLLAAMARSATRRVVFCSSFSVYDWSKIEGTLDEDSPLEVAPDLYERDGYAISKIWQERVTREAASKHGWELVVLRPGWIWGRDHGYIYGLGQQIGSVHLVFGPNARLPLTHVENCADLFATCVDASAATGRTYNVVDSDEVRIWKYLGDHLRRSEQAGLRIPIPYALGFLTARLAQATSRRIFHGKGKLPGVLVPCRFEARFKPLRFPSERVQRELGWRPPLSYEVCLERTYGPPPPVPVPRQERTQPTNGGTPSRAVAAPTPARMPGSAAAS